MGFEKQIEILRMFFGLSLPFPQHFSKSREIIGSCLILNTARNLRMKEVFKDL